MASGVVDVYVKLPSGRTSVHKLLPTDTVKKINEVVGKEEGIPANTVRMKFQGKILDKSKTIGYLGIRPETILKADIVIPKDIKVYVRVTDGGSVPVDVNTTSTVNHLKTVVECLDIVSPRKIQHFKHGGTTYRPSDTVLFETSIGEESVIEVKFKDAGETNDDTNGESVDPVDEDLKDTVLSSFQANGKNVEVVFSFDTTGSMSSYLTQVRQNLRQTSERLLRDIPNIRIGIIAHGDYCDFSNYVIKIQDLTSEVQQLVDFAENTPSTGGGDTPECYEWVLHKATGLDWSEDSAKALVVIGDCEPHPPSYTDQKINWHTELNILKGMGIKVYGVNCNRNASSEDTARHFYEELADRTGGCLLTLANFSLITEMFLGVCYKESNPEQLEAFTAELKQDGKFTEETENLMKQLEETKPKEDTDVEDKPSYLKKFTYDWWDFDENTNINHQYCYIAEKDEWDVYKNNNSPVVTCSSVFSTEDKSSPISHRYVSKHGKHRQRKTKCTIM